MANVKVLRDGKDIRDDFSRAIANLTLEEARAQLTQDLAANKEVLIIGGTKEVGKKMFGARNWMSLAPRNANFFRPQYW